MKCPRCGEDDIHGPVCSCGMTADHDARVAEIVADIRAEREQRRAPSRLEDALREIAELREEKVILLSAIKGFLSVRSNYGTAFDEPFDNDDDFINAIQAMEDAIDSIAP